MAKGVIRTTFGRIRSHHITDPNSVVCHSEQVCKDVRKEVTKWKPMFHRQTDRLYSPFSFWQTESATSNRHHRANPPHKDTHWPLISSIHWTKMMVNTHINPSLSNHTINIQSSANLLLIVVCCPVDLVMEGELFLYYPKTRHIDAGCLSMFRFFLLHCLSYWPCSSLMRITCVLVGFRWLYYRTSIDDCLIAHFRSLLSYSIHNIFGFFRFDQIISPTEKRKLKKHHRIFLLLLFWIWFIMIIH